jgi:YegS/Rv2252/BmrU family lipid kinase
VTLSPDDRRSVVRAAVVVLAAFTLLTMLVAFDSDAVKAFDGWSGLDPTLWHDRWPWVEGVLVAVELVFTTIPMLAYAAVMAAVLGLRRHARAGIWTIGLMAVAVVMDSGLKQMVDRPRPTWGFPVHTLTSPSYPSGHATFVATGAAIVISLSSVYVRRRTTRRWITAVAVAVGLLVGLDRLLLGVHTMSDVLAGYLLGAGLALTSLAIFDPTPQPSVRHDPRRPPHGRYLAVVLNPVKVEDPIGFRQAVERQARAAGWSSPAWHFTTPEDPGKAMAREALGNGADLVIVCGGDGTVRTVCAELAGTGVPVGVVPAGTGNMLARNLDLPMHLGSAIDIALNGQNRAIDLVRVSGDGLRPDETFLVMAGMGLDAAVMAAVDDAAKARVGWMAYWLAGFRNRMYPPIRVEISVDGGEWVKRRAKTVVVGNVGLLRGGIHLMPEATIDDGVLDVAVVHPRGLWSWIRVLARARFKDRREGEEIRRMRGQTVTLRVAHDAPRQIDGDSVGPGRELHCECLHGQLLVRVPR